MAGRVKIIVMAVQVKLAEPPLSANEEENDTGLIFGF